MVYYSVIFSTRFRRWARSCFWIFWEFFQDGIFRGSAAGIPICGDRIRFVEGFRSCRCRLFGSSGTRLKTSPRFLWIRRKSRRRRQAGCRIYVTPIPVRNIFVCFLGLFAGFSQGCRLWICLRFSLSREILDKVTFG